MKQRDLIKRIGQIATEANATWAFDSEGSRHEVWLLNGRKIEIPRHREINEITAKAIIKTAHKVIDGEDTPR